MTAQHDLSVVFVSIVIAVLASYAALELAKRVRTPDRAVATSWWIGGSLAMGSGIWAMHFVGMLAYSLPIAIGYAKLLTFVSWVTAVVVSEVDQRHALLRDGRGLGSRRRRVPERELAVERLALGADHLTRRLLQ